MLGARHVLGTGHRVDDAADHHAEESAVNRELLFVGHHVDRGWSLNELCQSEGRVRRNIAGRAVGGPDAGGFLRVRVDASEFRATLYRQEAVGELAGGLGAFLDDGL